MRARTTGIDNNYFKKVTVTDTTFPLESQVEFALRGPIVFSLVNEGDNVVEYSFNGNTLHGDMTPDSPTASLIFDDRVVSAIWFRSATSVIVRIEAWTKV